MLHIGRTTSDSLLKHHLINDKARKHIISYNMRTCFIVHQTVHGAVVNGRFALMSELNVWNKSVVFVAGAAVTCHRPMSAIYLHDGG